MTKKEILWVRKGMKGSNLESVSFVLADRLVVVPNKNFKVWRKVLRILANSEEYP